MTSRTAISGLSQAILAFHVMVAASHAGEIPVRLEPAANAVDLVVGPVASPGALFVLEAADLAALIASPTVLFQTNTPLINDLRLPFLPSRSESAQAFFAVLHWPNRSAAEFGQPESIVPASAPAAILLTAGAPPVLASGQAFTVDFFVADPAGRLLDWSGPVRITLVRRTDGTLHPDAQVTSAAQQLADGRLRADLRLEATLPLDGYVLGLAPATDPLPPTAKRETRNGPAAPELASAATPPAQTLIAALNLGPNPLPSPSAEALWQELEGRRQLARDPDPSWLCPLSPANDCGVGGTYGEWRGAQNVDIHEGVDLLGAPTSTVVATRGGVVSCQGNLPGLGTYLVLDHGDGWFSSYAGLEESAMVCGPGQSVARGAPLATALHAGPTGPVHLHFEIRRGSGQAQWMAPAPGESQDPLQTPAGFTVQPGSQRPDLEEIGLTRRHPGQWPFTKSAPAPNVAGGPVYLVGRCVDPEPGAGGVLRLGLRALALQAEGHSQPVAIHPSNATALAALRAPGLTNQSGFAKYGWAHAAIPDPLNWHPYWWAWDTTPYASNPKGPRTILLSAQDYAGTTNLWTLSFGPEIKSNRVASLGARAYSVTLVAHLGTTHHPPACAQPDQYRLEVLRADRTPMPGVQWTGTDGGDLTKAFTNHLDQAAYGFQVPAGESVTNLFLRVTSLMAPDLRHEVWQGTLRLSCRCAQAPELADIPAGSFVMGSPSAEAQRTYWEGPQTTVTLIACFKMGKHPVTQGQYRALMSNNPSYFSGNSNRPVEQVNWDEAMEYCRRLTVCEQQSGCLPTGWAYRLPTEAEWEYACRAGTTTAFCYGSALRSGMANFYGRYEYEAPVGTIYNPAGMYLGMPTEVGSYAPNAWGLCDLHGNVWEWCLDRWTPSLPGGSVVNPAGPAAGSYRVLRGGCWYNDATYCRSAYRLSSQPSYRGNDVGFRVVLAPIQP